MLRYFWTRRSRKCPHPDNSDWTYQNLARAGPETLIGGPLDDAALDVSQTIMVNAALGQIPCDRFFCGKTRGLSEQAHLQCS